jgi:3-phenylpropionate/trans-cinnamate dioxygenase ferredoxin reductase subunit
MVNPKDRDFVIVGASFAGAVAAGTLREEGFDGNIFLIGAEPHVPYERPPLSKTYLRGEAPREETYVHPEGFYEENGIELMTSTTVSEIDVAASEVVLDGGRRLRFDRLLLATGAEPRRLEVPGDGLEGVHYLRNLEDSDAIAERLVHGAKVVIVGGGWIGTEVAASARQKGLEVTLLQRTEVPLARQLGPDLGRVYRELHEERGVEFLATPGVTAFEADGAVRRVRTADGRTVEADFVVVATGVTPRTGLAERAGIAVDHGIRADEHLRTTVPAVFAAGDVANARNAFYGRSLRVEHWDNARSQGVAAALNMLGRDVRYNRIPYHFSDQYETGMEYWGDATGAERLVFRGDPNTLNFYAFWLDGEDRVTAGLNLHTHEHGHGHDASDHEHYDHGEHGHDEHGHGAAESVRPIEALIRSRRRFDARTLADPEEDLASLARRE